MSYFTKTEKFKVSLMCKKLILLEIQQLMGMTSLERSLSQRSRIMQYQLIGEYSKTRLIFRQDLTLVMKSMSFVIVVTESGDAATGNNAELHQSSSALKYSIIAK